MSGCAICNLGSHTTDRCTIFGHPASGEASPVAATPAVGAIPGPPGPPAPPGPPGVPRPPGPPRAPALGTPAAARAARPSTDRNGLTPDEQLAIFKYSDGGYNTMNRLLRNATSAPDQRAIQDITPEDFGNRLLTAARAMLKLPVWPGAYCLRGSGDFPIGSGLGKGKKISEHLKKLAAYQGSASAPLAVWSDTGFVSTTTSKTPFHTFTDGILWVIVTKGVEKHMGRDIQEYAKLKGEAEVTFPPGAEFDVLAFVDFDPSAHGQLIESTIWKHFKSMVVLRARPQRVTTDQLASHPAFIGASIRLGRPQFQPG